MVKDRFGSNPVIDNWEPNFRKGPKALICRGVAERRIPSPSA